MSEWQIVAAVATTVGVIFGGISLLLPLIKSDSLTQLDETYIICPNCGQPFNSGPFGTGFPKTDPQEVTCPRCYYTYEV